MSLDTSNRTYRQLVGSGLIYSVPRFQRDYSWADAEWDDLWQDIEGLFTEGGEEAHYMGYLVLQTKDRKNFDIIDGQQRLTTLSILVLAFLGNLRQLIEQDSEPERNRQRLEQLRSTFIGYLDPVTLIPRSKLNLNRNNDSLYQTYLVPLEPSPKRNLKATEHAMRKAYDWFYKKVKEKFSGDNRRGEVLAQYIDSLADKLFFTVISVNDELNAYKVFETLNARGVKLSSTDLLKNYLFAVVHNQGSDEHEIAELDRRWESLSGIIGSESLPDFLRAYWNSKNPFVRHAELFKRIRESVSSKKQVFDLMRDLKNTAHIFAALPNSEDDLWNSQQRKHIKTLRMFGVRQLYPLLLSAYRQLSEADFTKFLRHCSVISFRYNTIGNLSTSEQERIYNKLAVALSNGAINTLPELVAALAPLYVSDEKFRRDFSEKELRTTHTRNKRIVRYILFEIEHHMSNRSYDFESESYNLEHIMPESIHEGWDNIEDRDHDRFVYRLGNITLLNKGVNRDLGNTDFPTKKEKYLESEFLITQRVATENRHWNPERIAEHQKWMANQATAIWNIAQLVL